VVVQGDMFNRSKISTVVYVALTSNIGWAEVPENVVISPRQTGLPKQPLANVSQWESGTIPGNDFSVYTAGC